jgi:uncharacterized protein (TIGR03066 family)
MMVTGLFLVGVVAGVRAADIDKEKLVGSWEVIKADEGAPPVGTAITFTKDGKVKVVHKVKDEERTGEGTFNVKGDKLSVTVKHGDKEDTHTVTITKLSDTEVTGENEKGAKFTLKRKK